MRFFIMISVTLAAFFAASMASASPLGVWLRANKESKIEIKKCGDSYCGTVVWMIAKNAAKKDVNNKNPALQNRSILGIQIFSNMVPDGANKWKGDLYNPEDGGTYSGTLKQPSKDTLTLKGCWVWPLCKNDTWTRTTR